MVETNLVPKTRISGNLFLAAEQARTEPIAGRIIEVPENEEQAETYRNPRSGFVAYVPVGSIKKGKDLVTTGGMRIVGDKIVQGKTTPCGTCHGLDLMGVPTCRPSPAARRATWCGRCWDMQQGTRNGASAQLMKLVVANLTEEDLVSIAAYVSSRGPTTAAAAPRIARAAPRPPAHYRASNATLHAGLLRRSGSATAGATIRFVRIPFSLPAQGARPYDVVGFGENSVDLVAVVAEYPTPNSKQRLQRFARLPGGQIATALAVCARLGCRARYLGSFGDDPLGVLSRESLSEHGVDVSAARVVAGATNRFAVVLVDARSGERTVLWDRHPDLTMTPPMCRGKPSRPAGC